MRRFDYLFLKEMNVPSSFIDKTMWIASLKEMTSMRMADRPNVFSELESSAKLLSVKGSNAIEGIRTSDNRLESLMDRIVEPIGHDEEEIAGYRDALSMIHNGYREMKLDENTILELHRILMSHTNTPGGTYKNSDNVIVKIDRYGNRRVYFRPLSAEDTPGAMEQMVLAYIVARQNGVNPLLLIPCFILDFLSIHPFNDGNGRMSRLLTLMLLYQSGYDAGRYMSFEERIDLTKDQYYKALALSSDGWHIENNDYIPFINYYTDVLLMCYRSLDRCFATVQGKNATKSNRIEAVVLNSLVPISKKEIMSIIPDVSQTTVEACLHRMLMDGRIKKIGNNRNSRYMRND